LGVRGEKAATVMSIASLTGARGSKLAVEQATEFALRIYLKTAKAAGFTIPLVARADEVME
jgi:hypothetical protein